MGALTAQPPQGPRPPATRPSRLALRRYTLSRCARSPRPCRLLLRAAGLRWWRTARLRLRRALPGARQRDTRRGARFAAPLATDVAGGGRACVAHCCGRPGPEAAQAVRRAKAASSDRHACRAGPRSAPHSPRYSPRRLQRSRVELYRRRHMTAAPCARARVQGFGAQRARSAAAGRCPAAKRHRCRNTRRTHAPLRAAAAPGRDTRCADAGVSREPRGADRGPFWRRLCDKCAR